MQTQSMKSVNYLLGILMLFGGGFWLDAKGAATSDLHRSAIFNELACNDFVNLSLDGNCQLVVSLNMLLEAQVGPNSDYLIQLKEGNVLQPDLILGASDIGKVYTFNVIHLPSGNSCWGYIKVEDKLAPTVACANDTIRCGGDTRPEVLGFPIPSSVIYSISVCNKELQCYQVLGWDACTAVNLTYHDDVFELPCDSIFSRTIVRCWTAVDQAGNKATCCDTIFVRKADFSDLVIPPHYDGVAKPFLHCYDNYPKLNNGNPDPVYTGWPVPSGCSKLVATYSDLKINICENSYKIVRRWIILDWCTREIFEYNQLIKVVDDRAPEFKLPDNFFIGMKTYTCGSYGKLPIPENVVDCGNWTYTILSKLIDENGNPLPATADFIKYDPIEKVYYLDGAPEGKIWLIYEVSDNCGNSSFKQIEVGVVDELLPIPVCDQKTVVTLTSDGTARIFATTFDDGSVDNCGVLEFKARRMDDPCGNGTNVFGNYVDFCCEDVGKTVMVAMEVFDNSRNSNTCMVEVVVQEKEPPVLIPPTDITVTCGYDVSDLSKFGVIRYSEADRKPIVINDYFYNGKNNVAGQDGLATDNCHVEVTELVIRNLNCNLGVITRIFTAKDKQGLTTIASQNIYIHNPFPFNVNNIQWPTDRTIFSCRAADVHPDVTGSPTYSNTGCATLAANYEDQLLLKVDTSCYKIFRKWSVVDWCQFNAQNNNGLWTHTQILYVVNTVPPDILSCSQLDICDNNSYYDPSSKQCMVNVDITGDAEDDCTRKEFLKWNYRLDTNNDGVFESLQNGNHLKTIMPVGTFSIRWIVEDACGNVSSCDQRVILRDCKRPTPYCLNGITTVIMPVGGTVTVWAKDLNLGSYDNCTQQDRLKFSFTKDITSTSITYTCDSLNGQSSVVKTVRMYVTDETGNQDYCETAIRIQDNNHVCGGTLVNVNGLVMRNAQQGMPGAQVSIVNALHDTVAQELTDKEGRYTFQSVPWNNEYAMSVSKEDEILSGVSTYDLVLIQRHILGKAPFTSPLEFLAADVNHSKSITARDISDIRKVILGVQTSFPSQRIWRFINQHGLDGKTDDPWDAGELWNFKDVLEEFKDLNFIGIKEGDVDQSSSLNRSMLQSRSIQQWSLGEPVNHEGHQWYPVIAENGGLLEGFQMSLTGRNIMGLVSAELAVGNEHFVLSNGLLNVSWTSHEAQQVNDLAILFYIECSGRNSEIELLNGASIMPEIYIDHQIRNLALRGTSGNDLHTSIELGQNIPNPFNDQTVIPVMSSQNTSAVLRIFDVNGKVVYSRNIQLVKGSNQIKVDRNMLGAEGIYMYELGVHEGYQVRKMLLKI